ncbi:alpha/beta hydrolase [Aureivirga sp. CE67]|uniref:alpha/beta hydrolase n=1 Tax=Aureivirga sp. CE67 TaxID=1788983 RepID=UPI0018C9F5A8|nr:alpha/beta hydrolase-fold protein [Aureivirga sp. CE67]
MKHIYILFFLFSFSIFSQSHSFYTKPDTLEIKSSVFKKNRKITISKPLNYNKINTSKHCVLYTDANDEEITATVLQSANNLYLYDEIPQSILIGIIHEDRNKELTEKENLEKFIVDEVLPFLKKKYNVMDKMTLIGHSFGGYFMTNLFLDYNDKFNSCIVISPAYWPNDGDVQTKLLTTDALKGNLYLAIGDRRWDDISIKKYYDLFVTEINTRNFKDLRFKNQLLEGFSHNSTPTIGIPSGLNFCFDAWEWNYIVEEQNQRIKAFPDFWRHYKLKAEALENLNKNKEALEVYKQCLEKIDQDREITKLEKKYVVKRLKKKIKYLQNKTN